VSLSTNVWKYQFSLLEQSQDFIELSKCLLKNALRSLDIIINWSWYRYIKESNILYAVYNASVMTII